MRKLLELNHFGRIDFILTDSEKPYESEFEKKETILLEKYLFVTALALGEERIILRDEFEIMEKKSYTNEITWELYGPYYPFGGNVPASSKVKIKDVSYPYFNGIPLDEETVFACFKYFAKKYAITEDLNQAFMRWIDLMKKEYNLKLLSYED